MYDAFKARFDRTKQFVQAHTTAVACGATAVITWKLTKDVTLKSVLNETTPMAYQWGQQRGQLEMLLDESYNFIRERGLEPEFVDFANMTRAT